MRQTDAWRAGGPLAQQLRREQKCNVSSLGCGKGEVTTGKGMG